MLDAGVEARIHKGLKSLWGAEAGLALIEEAQRIEQLDERFRFYTAALEDAKLMRQGKTPKSLEALKVYRREPVDVLTFMTHPYYLNKGSEIYPKVMEELVEINSGQYVEVVLTGGIGCVTGDTEFLSERGWVRFDQYDGQSVAAYDQHTGKVSFVPGQFHVYPCQEVWAFKTKYGVDMRLSDEHRVLYRTTKGNLRVLTAKEVADQHARSVKGFTGRLLTTFKVDKAGVDLTPAQLRLQVAVQADGTFNLERDGRKVTFNLKKGRKKARLIKLLTEAGVAYNESHLASGYSRFYFDAPLRTKRYDWAWECSAEQLEVIAQECVYWDGNQSSTFYTAIESDADFMSYCFSATGRRAVVDGDERGFCECLYSVRASSNTEITLQGVPKTPVQRVPTEDGHVYCFTVPTGFFVARRNGRVFVTGNSAKTTTALYTTAYQLYLLSCYRNPHGVFGLDRASEILFIFQNISEKLARGVDYQRFRSMVEGIPYFKEHFPFNADLASKLVFPNRIEVVPVSGLETAAIGQNVMGGIIDELNYMAVVDRSRQSVDHGTYDQAVALYNSIARRRKSRFMTQGKLPGILCLVSSKRYPGQFTDIKMEEARTDPTIYVYDRRVWDIKPEGTFSGELFPVFIGDEGRRPRILTEEEAKKEESKYVDWIPVEFKTDFEKDILNALREIAGQSTLARTPFFTNPDKISQSLGSVPSVFDCESVDFVETQLRILPKNFWKPKLPRFAHIDLAVSSDSAGLVIGTVSEFVRAGRNDDLEDKETTELLPKFHIDGVLEIRPPKNGEIQFWKIRNILYVLRDQGLNIKWVTFDSFQSTDSMQLLRQKGFTTGYTSMDTSTAPYDFLKTAFYDGRVLAPAHKRMQLELVSLEKDMKKGKIDHPPRGSKDCADALAGVVYGLTTRREIWGVHGIPLLQIPESVKRLARKDDQ